MLKLTHLAAISCLGLATAAFAAPPSDAPSANSPSTVSVPNAPASVLAKIHPGLLLSEGQVNVVVRLSDAPLSVAAGKNAKKTGSKLTRSAQVAHVKKLQRQQEAIVSTIQKNGGKVTARLTKVLNAVAASVDARVLPQIAALGTVAAIRPVADYELDLASTVPYIGAKFLQDAGVDGTGVRVAVLDSGVDYTHKNLGGAGTLEAYAAAYGDPASLDGALPTAKVIGGYDFVGENWPNTGLEPDEDPIDFQGHGTHVADIVAGASLDGTHKGVAPGAKLYSFKVCSAVTTSCSGVAMIQGFEAALDPNLDDVLDDAVDVVNMSVGSSYGQLQDDSALAAQNTVDYGVVVVISAGNSGDKPYVTGSPSVASGVISVAQTQVPDALAISLNTLQGGVPAVYPNTATLDWAPITASTSAAVVKAGNPVNTLCSLPAPGAYAGKFVLIDRGGCNISFKVHYASYGGAVGVILANNAAGDPPSFSYGGRPTDIPIPAPGEPDNAPLIPTIVISQADGATIKALLGGAEMVATLDPAVGTSLAGSMASTSSRGPSYSTQEIKPDIGAPGASLSAEVGTGDGETAFGGTSGAAPMVAGSAALILDAFPGLLPHEVKARLMNTADKNVQINPATLPGVLAPITRIGGGEVRVDKAVATKTLAYDRDSKNPSLSFGYRPTIKAGASGNKFRRTLEIRNLDTVSRTYALSSTFRYADDAGSGAVSLSFSPANVVVPQGGTKTVQVTLSVDGSKLPAWNLNGGSQGGNGTRLRGLEYDGYVSLKVDGTEMASVPWHVLPRKAADVRPASKTLTLAQDSGTLTLKNVLGSTDGTTEVFELLGSDPVDYPLPAPAGSNIGLVDLKSFGVRSFLDGGDGYLQFAFATYGEPSHPNYPVEFLVEIFTNFDQDGNFEYYQVFNGESGGFASSGQNVGYVYDGQTDETTAWFFTDSDLNSGAVIMTVPMSALNMALDPVSGAASYMAMFAYGIDNYFTGAITDDIADDADGNPMWYTPGIPRFLTDATVSVPTATPSTATLGVDHIADGDFWSYSVDGLLLFHRNALPKRWSDEIIVNVPVPVP